MGTSASYSAPPSWGDLKTSVTRHANEGHTAPYRVGELLKSFVSHNGGANGISRRGGGVAKGSNAKATASRLGGFLASVGSLGLDGAMQANGWADLIGKPVKVILGALLDRWGGDASTIDHVDARMALSALEKEY